MCIKRKSQSGNFGTDAHTVDTVQAKLCSKESIAMIQKKDNSPSRGTYSNTYPPKFFLGTTYEVKVDYLQHTAQEAYTLRGADEIPPIPFYKKGYRAPDGVRFYHGNPKTDKWLVIASGWACDQIRKEISIPQYLGNVIESGCNISRIDIACDVLAGVEDDGLFFSVDRMIEMWQSKKMQNKHVSKKPKLISSIDDRTFISETFSLGIENRGRTGMLRVYDKGIESECLAEWVTRIEIEERKKYAHRVATHLVDKPIEGVFKAKFDVLDNDWQSLFDKPMADLTRGKEKDAVKSEKEKRDATWEWLIEKVAPTVGRSLACDFMEQNTLNYELFNEAVQKAFDEQIASGLCS